jgi:hypothetical protein
MKATLHLILAVPLSLYSAHAGALTFTIQAYGLGWLGDDSFVGQAITFTGAGDTGNVFRTAGGEYRLNLAPGAATVSISGIGGLTLDIGSAYIFSNPAASFAGFGVGTVDVLAIANPSLSNYRLSSPIGPLDGPAYGPITILSTPMGPLDLQYFDPAPYGFFEAASAPEPPSAVLCALPVFLLGVMALFHCLGRRRSSRPRNPA